MTTTTKQHTAALRRASFTPPLDALDAAAVYEPAEDTFLLCDALWAEAPWLCDTLGVRLGAEVGVGSGYVSATLLAAFAARRHRCAWLGTDVNARALQCAARTLEASAHAPPRATLVRGSLCAPLRAAAHALDVLVFNPPYVPSDASVTGTSATLPLKLETCTASALISAAAGL